MSCPGVAVASRLSRDRGPLARGVGALRATAWPGHKLLHIKSGEDFKEKILRADVPALVMFNKTICPTCVWMEPGLDRLADEYRGRAIIARYRHINPLFIHTSWEITKKFKVYLVPTVILFAGGRERGRWFMEYDMDVYRKALDEVLGEQPPGQSPAQE